MRTLPFIIAFSAFLLAWVLQAAAQSDDPDSLLNRIDNLYEQGKYKEAIPLSEQVVAIYEKSLGPEHPDTAQSLNNLASLYQRMGDYARAEPLFHRSLKIREKVLGPDHPITALALNNSLGVSSF